MDVNRLSTFPTLTPLRRKALGPLIKTLDKNYLYNSSKMIFLILNPLKLQTISKSEREALQTLINRTDIVINPADQGKATVILNTDDNKKECYRQLNDYKFYRKLQKDTTHHIEEQIKRRFKDMMIDDEIDEETYNYLLPRRSRPARFYILPKIDKNKDNPQVVQSYLPPLTPQNTSLSL